MSEASGTLGRSHQNTAVAESDQQSRHCCSLSGSEFTARHLSLLVLGVIRERHPARIGSCISYRVVGISARRDLVRARVK